MYGRSVYIYSMCHTCQGCEGDERPYPQGGIVPCLFCSLPSPQAHPQRKTSDLSEQTPTHTPAMNILQAAV